jgi:hypothetical protein
MDGRPLTASTVVGRTVVGGRDQPIPPGELDAFAENLIGSRPQAVPQRDLGGDSGRLTRAVDPVNGESIYTLYVNQNLSPELQQRVVAMKSGITLMTLPATSQLVACHANSAISTTR